MNKRLVFGAVFLVMPSLMFGEVADDSDGLFDSTSYVETNSTTNTNSNVTSDNTNTNVNTTTVDSTSVNTNNNTNVNTNTNNTTVNSTSNNTNNNINTTTSDNTNTNINTSTSTSTIDQTVDQTVNSTSNNTNTNNNTNVNTNTSNNTNTNNNTNNSTSNNTNTNNNNNKSDVTQTIKSPPPSAIAPTVNAGGNDTCTVSYSAAVQSQILGIAGGGHVRDLNCERLKNAKTLYNMGMKVASVSLMCQDSRVFEAMEMAGTPCPFNGKIGEEAKELWAKYPELKPTEQEEETRRNDTLKGIGWGVLGSALLMYATGGAAF